MALNLTTKKEGSALAVALKGELNPYKSMKAKNGAMELFNVGPSFKEVLNITGLDAVFDVK